MRLLYAVFAAVMLLVTAPAALSQAAPPNISWFSPLRGSTVDFTNGAPYLVVFTPSSLIQVESIDIYSNCDGVRGQLVANLGVLNVSVGHFSVTLNTSLSPTMVYCFEMSDVNYWYNSPPFFAITSQSTGGSGGSGLSVIGATSASSTATGQPISSTDNSTSSGNGNSSSSSPSGLSGGAIGGIAAGGVAIIAAAFFTGCYIRRRKPDPAPEPTPYTNGQTFQPPPRQDAVYSAYSSPPRQDTVYSAYSSPSRQDTGYPAYSNPPAITAPWSPQPQDPNYFVPMSQKPQGGMYGQPQSPAELENMYGSQPYQPKPQVSSPLVSPAGYAPSPQVSQPVSPVGYAPSPPPPFHTVLKPYDPEPAATQQPVTGRGEYHIPNSQ